MASKYALFAGCKIPYYVPQYGMATASVLAKLGIELVEPEFGCCGYPVRQQDQRAYLASAAKNLAIAQAEGLDILTPCQCCFGSLKKAVALMEDEAQLDAANRVIRAEGLSYSGSGVEVKHLLQVLSDDVGPAKIKSKVTLPYEDLNIAVHYGCHALRPSKLVQFDDPLNPTLFDDLVEATGAKSVDWDHKTQCCGNPLWGKNDKLAQGLTAKKIQAANRAGAELVCVGCTYCQIQFDQVQPELLPEHTELSPLPSVVYPQLLGLAMGMQPKDLGLDKHNLDVSFLVDKLPEPEEEAAEEAPEDEAAA